MAMLNNQRESYAPVFCCLRQLYAWLVTGSSWGCLWSLAAPCCSARLQLSMSSWRYPNSWMVFVIENPSINGWFGVPLFQETSIYIYPYINHRWFILWKINLWMIWGYPYFRKHRTPPLKLLYFGQSPPWHYFVIVSDISSGSTYGTYFLTFYSGILSDILFWHSISHLFWHPIWHPWWHLFWHFLWHSIWHPFWYSIWHLFWHSFWHLFWHPVSQADTSLVAVRCANRLWQ